MDELKLGGVYKIKSRNLKVAVWDGAGWIGIRNKFDYRYLESSEHVKFVFQQEYLGQVDSDIELKVFLRTECMLCKTVTKWTGPPAPAPWVCEGGCEDPRPCSISNDRLFKVLNKFEEEFL